MLHICLALFNRQLLKRHESQAIVNISSIANIIILDIFPFGSNNTWFFFFFDLKHFDFHLLDFASAPQLTHLHNPYVGGFKELKVKIKCYKIFLKEVAKVLVRIRIRNKHNEKELLNNWHGSFWVPLSPKDIIFLLEPRTDSKYFLRQQKNHFHTKLFLE